MLLEIIRSLGIPIAPAELSPSEFLQMGRLRMDKHLVERRYRQPLDQSEIDP